jgi:hypothetical protein
MLGSESEQREYEQKVSHVDVTKELLAGWSSDSYHPEDAGFSGCFSEMELVALADFDRKFNASVTSLPTSNGTVEAWLSSPVWHGVMEYARLTRMQIHD